VTYSEEEMVENLKQTQPKILSFSYRNTSMKGFDETIIMSFRTGRVINSTLQLSRSGSHGVRQYKLLPAKYLMYEAHRSNLGNTYIYVKVIEVDENGTFKVLQEWNLYNAKEQKMSLNDLPENIKTILLYNKEQLPLFRYVYDEEFVS